MRMRFVCTHIKNDPAGFLEPDLTISKPDTSPPRSGLKGIYQVRIPTGSLHTICFSIAPLHHRTNAPFSMMSFKWSCKMMSAAYRVCVFSWIPIQVKIWLSVEPSGHRHFPCYHFSVLLLLSLGTWPKYAWKSHIYPLPEISKHLLSLSEIL